MNVSIPLYINYSGKVGSYSTSPKVSALVVTSALKKPLGLVPANSFNFALVSCINFTQQPNLFIAMTSQKDMHTIFDF